MKYDDLLNVPYKEQGRTKEEGFDCFGVCVEMCRRDGKILKDPFKDIKNISNEEANDYINEALNIKEIPKAEPGAIVEFFLSGNLHAGYVVKGDLMIHATKDKGVRISPIKALNPVAFYEVINESDNL
ncbi:NlpC/P60 family protein [Treponema pectinovorum]|uniref:NlpC/P60 family protein n=1 Tax=Treponema pectinovorum TaxID=164 RepID=UPI0011C70F67|nr:NlpC/P60 family protein [Treponema pectinovorum]